MFTTSNLRGGQHPANFLGCKVRSEIQKRKSPPLKKEEKTQNTDKQGKTKSYSAILCGAYHDQDQVRSLQSHKAPDPASNESINNNDYQFKFELLVKRIEAQEKLLETEAQNMAEISITLTEFMNRFVSLI